ncbi:NAD(P)H-hydrate dehydratase [Pseudaeromonas sharmana]|uniref:Bifunctional NAD(P)H-hydrate repair enzyme n=1 Tax=Pseudaeromonas sharmana TaxID=328412 RepID=A0ABV8CLT5_9GAMM
MSAPDQPAATLPYSLYCTEQIHALEALAMAQCGAGTLMARAGQALFACATRISPARASACWWIFCGSGNNGGDGYVLARLARAAGVDVQLFAVAAPRPGSEAEAACQAWLAAGGSVLSRLPTTISSLPALLVDALLGIGLRSAPRPEYADWMAFINAQPAPVLAVDIPSGLLADTGAAPGAVVHADVTLSLLALKPGLFTGRGADYCGRVCHAALDVDVASLGGVLPSLQRLDYQRIGSLLTPRSRTAHKGECGRVLIVGGAEGMSGAVRLAGEGALRSGAGLVRVFTHPAHASVLNLGRAELMVSSGRDEEAVSDCQWANIRVVGPGLGQAEWGQQVWFQQLALPGPLLLDADGLNLLARNPRHRDDWILTPHPGEAARLLDCSTSDIEADRITSVRRLQQRYGGVVLLKGAGTLICDGDQIWLCHEGNPGMASGGMGDLLSGIIAALYAQGLSQAEACCAGACIHGEAADLAAADGERGLLASDLLLYIRKLVNPQDSMKHVSLHD